MYQLPYRMQKRELELFLGKNQSEQVFLAEYGCNLLSQLSQTCYVFAN